MAQYKIGSASVTNGSATVTGVDTLWSAEVSAGDIFTIVGDNAWYEVGSVGSNTSITLTSTYAGSTASGAQYAISRDFTTNKSIPYPQKGDIETASLLKRAMNIIDNELSTGFDSSNVTITGGTINGTTIGATTAAAVSATTLTTSSTVTHNGGTANGVAYLNGSKVLTTGSALTFDGSTFATTGDVLLNNAKYYYGKSSAGSNVRLLGINSGDTLYLGIDSGPTSMIVNASSTSTNIAFSASGAEQMRLTSTGLGIGTSSPGAKLHIQATTGFTPQIMMGQTSSYRLDVGYNNSAEYGFLQAYAASTSVYDDIVINPLGGNVGIGTSSPAYRLDVVGTANTFMSVGTTGSSSGRAILYLDKKGTATKYNWLAGAQYNVDNAFEITPSTAVGGTTFSTPSLVVLQSGNVGIGTSSPQTRLHVSDSDANSVALFERTTTGSNSAVAASRSVAKTSVNAVDGFGSLHAFSMQDDTSGRQNLGYIGAVRSGADDTGSIVFVPVSGGTATERARIDSSGNLLVGATSTGVSSGGLALLPNSGNSAISVGHTTGTASGEWYGVFRYAGTAIGAITQSGTTAVSYVTSSDYRLKNITGPITTSGAYIDSLNPVEGTWKADGSTFVGLIAHEVQEASRTNVATGVKDGEEMQGMDYSNAELIANMLAELKSLRARVAALESI